MGVPVLHINIFLFNITWKLCGWDVAVGGWDGGWLVDGWVVFGWLMIGWWSRWSVVSPAASDVTILVNDFFKIYKCNNPITTKLWYRIYYEHIIAYEQAYQNIRGYIFITRQNVMMIHFFVGARFTAAHNSPPHTIYLCS